MLAGFSEKYGITFSLLSDEGSVVIRRLSLLNEQVRRHHEFYGIPWREDVAGVPYSGAFLLDEHGVIAEKRFIVHEGMLKVGLPLTFTKRVGDQTIAATVRYQACSATDCLIPQAIRLELPVRNVSHIERDI